MESMRLYRARKRLNKFATWAPRLLAILYAAFIALFALDVFATSGSLLYKLMGFLVHLAPALIVLVALWLAWKRELAGGVIYLLLGVFFTFRFKTYIDAANFMSLSFPLFLTGLLFIAAHLLKQRPVK